MRILGVLQEILAAKCDISVPMDPRDMGVVQILGLPVGEKSGTRSILGQRVRGKALRDSHWMLPPLGVLKINTDGSFRGNLGHVGVGGIGRDSSRVVEFFFSGYRGQHSNNFMESLAIILDLKRACLGWRRIICDSNSQIVIDLLKNSN